MGTEAMPGPYAYFCVMDFSLTDLSNLAGCMTPILPIFLVQMLLLFYPPPFLSVLNCSYDSSNSVLTQLPPY